MHRKKSITIIVIGAAVLGIGFMVRHVHRAPIASPDTGKKPRTFNNAAPASVKPHPKQLVKSISQAEFDRLVEKWRPFNTGPSYFVYTAEELDFARECVRQLGCGDDLIRLIGALRLQDKGILDYVFNPIVKELLAGESSALLRADVAGITIDLKIREQWSYFAGAGCTPKELGDFAQALTNELDRDAARLGNCLKLASSDPAGAIKLASEQLTPEKNGIIRGKVFSDIVQSAKDIATYPVILAELNAIPTDSGHSGGFIHNAKQQLLGQWTDASVPAVIDYLNGQAGEASPEDAGFIFSRIASFKGSREAFNSLQDLKYPEHFDQAAASVIHYTSEDFPKESFELAQQITSESVRKAAILHIDQIERNSNANLSEP